MKKYILVPVVILKTRSGYNAFSPIVEGCVVTDKTIDRTLKRMKEALEFHFEGELLVKSRAKISIKQSLRKAFEKYEADAVYASLKIAA